MPQELAESLVVGDGFIVVLCEAVLNILKTPFMHQLAGGFGFLRKCREDMNYTKKKTHMTHSYAFYM